MSSTHEYVYTRISLVKAIQESILTNDIEVEFALTNWKEL